VVRWERMNSSSVVPLHLRSAMQVFYGFMNTPEQESSLLTLEECIQREYSMRENLRPRVGWRRVDRLPGTIH
jgi:hypothetical protein